MYLVPQTLLNSIRFSRALISNKISINNRNIILIETTNCSEQLIFSHIGVSLKRKVPFNKEKQYNKTYSNERTSRWFQQKTNGIITDSTIMFLEDRIICFTGPFQIQYKTQNLIKISLIRYLQQYQMFCDRDNHGLFQGTITALVQ